MSVHLNELLEHVLEGEPALSDEVDEIFRRAGKLRRRRTRILLGSGIVVSAVIALAGYLLTTALLPGAKTPTARPSAAAPSVSVAPAVVVPSAVTDGVLATIAPLVDSKQLQIVPRRPDRGDGWRQYTVLDRGGASRGTVEVAIFDAPDKMCFPVRADPVACAHTEQAAGGIEYVRYDDDRDLDWQVHQTVARRPSDGRAVVVMATGERGTGDAVLGKPALTGAEVEKVATGAALFAAFGSDERCTANCPAFKVPVGRKK
ncbi:MAG: hypothetical protein ABW046_06785 [Actinoplanes sp.]